MILFGGTHKKTSRAADFSALLLKNSSFSSINFLYSFRSLEENSTPLIDIKDLLLKNALQEYHEISEKIRSQISEKIFTSDFQVDISSHKFINYVKKHKKKLIILGQADAYNSKSNAAIKEVSLFLRKTSSSMLIVPEKAKVEFPRNAQVISNLSSPKVISVLEENFSYIPEQIRINSIGDKALSENLKTRSLLCQIVKEKNLRLLNESSTPKDSDIIILVADKIADVPLVEMKRLYELCTKFFHVPLLIINPKLINTSTS